MFAFTPAVSVLLLLASQVSAFTFNVTFGTQNLAAADVLPSITGVLGSCNSDCNPVQSALAACNDDASCLCASPLVKQFLACEQCMYETLINQNVHSPDPKAGSTPMLQGYSAACAAFNITLNATQTALVLPTNWDGPFGLGLNTVGTVFTVGAAVFLGVSSLLILSNL